MQPDRTQELARWASEQLAALGWPRPTGIETVKDRPWSLVLRVITPRGVAYAKANCPGLACEAPLVAYLAKSYADVVVDVLATEDSRGWLLMPDGGASIRESLEGREQRSTWLATIKRYVALQRGLQDELDLLLSFGVPDMRPQSLGRHWDHLLEHWALAVNMPDGLTPDEHAALHALTPRVRAWADELADSPVTPSLQHDDLHANNIFARDGRMFDWGDAIIAHPFGSLLTATHYLDDLDFGSTLRRSYLHQWADVAPMARLRRDAELAVLLGYVCRALNWLRIPGAGADRSLGPLAVPGWLRQLLRAAAQS